VPSDPQLGVFDYRIAAKVSAEGPRPVESLFDTALTAPGVVQRSIRFTEFIPRVVRLVVDLQPSYVLVGGTPVGLRRN
jgi:hypothetical protein